MYYNSKHILVMLQKQVGRHTNTIGLTPHTHTNTTQPKARSVAPKIILIYMENMGPREKQEPEIRWPKYPTKGYIT